MSRWRISAVRSAHALPPQAAGGVHRVWFGRPSVALLACLTAVGMVTHPARSAAADAAGNAKAGQPALNGSAPAHGRVAQAARRHVITNGSRYDVQQWPSNELREFLAKHPEMGFEQWVGIPLPFAARQSSLAMAMAANIGPDIFESDIRQSVAQGMSYPLTEWIGEDGTLADGTPKLKPDGSRDLNGQIDADEAKWDGWMRIKPLFRQVVTVDGKPYAVPRDAGNYIGILYSHRLLLRAGLDPRTPPRSWDEFIRWARILYDRERRIPAASFTAWSWAFAPWVAAAGSSIVVQDRTSPASGKVYTFGEQATDLHAPDTGEDLRNAAPRWRTNVASPGGVAAMGFYHRLRWAPWIWDGAAREPLELTPEDLAHGYAAAGDRRVSFREEDVIEGCIEVPTLWASDETMQRMGRELALVPIWSTDLTEFQGLVQLDDMGMMAFPPRDASLRPVLQASNCFFLMGKDVALRGGDTPEERKAYRDLVWALLTIITSPEGGDAILRQKVAAGQARFLNPRDLRRLGMTDYLKEMAPEYLAMWDDLDSGRILEVVEPFMGKWTQFRDFYQREAIELVLRPSGKNFDHAAALARIEREANGGIMFERPKAEIDRQRPAARIVAAVVMGIFVLFTFLIARGMARQAPSTVGVYKGWLPWWLLVPALASIALWGYYPLLRGLAMAFQDYHIVGRSPFVGLDNFIGIALDPNFYHYVYTTLRFVLVNMVLAFFTPILLAFLLNEVPRLKVFFRTLFFLPQMTSGLVVSLMWRDMFGGTAAGTFNRLLTQLFGPLGFKPIDWLGDPRTVMACVILPGVWAQAGIASLIYLAALKSVPDELYEAASMDGAGIRRKIAHIAVPIILPLVLINFVGTFIGTFQSMGSIFLLTFGGPGKETMVLSMAIWQEAYANLRFSLATCYAWILGSALIAFTYLQMRILRRVNFRRSQAE